MNAAQEPTWLQQAKTQGLVPADAQLPPDHSRPWPVVALTAFGAWLAGLPLLGVIAIAVGDFLQRGVTGLVVGGLLVLAAIAALGAKDLPLFVEQLAVPALWAGVAAMGVSLTHYVSTPTMLLLLAALMPLLALLLPSPSRAWLRVLLGASCAALLMVGLSSTFHYDRSDGPGLVLSPWLSAHGLVALWLAWSLWNSRAAQSGLLAVAQAFATGWVISAIAALAWVSGPSFLMGGNAPVGDVLSSADRTWGPGRVMLSAALRSGVSAALAALAAWRMLLWFESLPVDASHAASTRLQASVASLGVGAVLVVLAWFMPSLGAVLLLAIGLLSTRHYKLAVLAGVAAVWVVGSFYYHLSWPLATKAVVLVGVAAVLAALAYAAYRARAAAAAVSGSANTHAHASASAPRHWLQWVLPLLTAALTLVAANVAIGQKERLIRDGKAVFVRLAPVDPRSLMQGDYMALRFSMPDTGTELSLTGAQRPLAVGKIDAKGVLSLERIVRPGERIAADETAIELTPKDGDWALVTDAWFFKEGDAQRWEQARYGEFRAAPDGKALLVGMADEQLKAIKP